MRRVNKSTTPNHIQLQRMVSNLHEKLDKAVNITMSAWEFNLGNGIDMRYTVYIQNDVTTYEFHTWSDLQDAYFHLMRGE
jgi:hypothetical protein